MSELKPCPFCGSVPNYEDGDASCSNDSCLMGGLYFDTVEWNTRPPLTAATVREAGITCGTCDRKEPRNGGGLKCTYFNATTPSDGFCHMHPKFKEEG